MTRLSPAARRLIGAIFATEDELARVGVEAPDMSGDRHDAIFAETAVWDEARRAFPLVDGFVSDGDYVVGEPGEPERHGFAVYDARTYPDQERVSLLIALSPETVHALDAGIAGELNLAASDSRGALLLDLDGVER